MTGPEAIAIVERRLHQAEQLYGAVQRSPNRQALARVHIVMDTLTEVLTDLRRAQAGVNTALTDEAQALLRGE